MCLTSILPVRKRMPTLPNPVLSPDKKPMRDIWAKVEELYELGFWHPSIGFCGAFAFGAMGALTNYFPRGFGPYKDLCGFTCWMMAVITAVGAVMGILLAGSRKERLLAEHSLAEVRNLPFQFFEQLVADVYQRHGYEAQIIGGPDDEGVDVVLTSESGDVKIVQCKQTTLKIRVNVVRELIGALACHGKAQGAILVTSGDFTAEAITLAKKHQIELVNGPALMRLLNVARARAGGEIVPEVPASDVLALYNLPAPICPRCGSRMEVRTAHQGPFTGLPFWGCRSFPKCRIKIHIEESAAAA